MIAKIKVINLIVDISGGNQLLIQTCRDN